MTRTSLTDIFGKPERLLFMLPPKKEKVREQKDDEFAYFSSLIPNEDEFDFDEEK
jgi:hypothetical protein